MTTKSAQWYPVPGERMDDKVIVASVIVREPDDAPVEQLVLYLNEDAPYFGLAIISKASAETAPMVGWHMHHHIGDFWNIVRAVREYEQNGGDI